MDLLIEISASTKSFSDINPAFNPTWDLTESSLVKIGTTVIGSLEAYSVGQTVRITEGPFLDFMGIIEEVYGDRSKVKVLVSFFGRETPVELDFVQIERI